MYTRRCRIKYENKPQSLVYICKNRFSRVYEIMNGFSTKHFHLRSCCILRKEREKSMTQFHKYFPSRFLGWNCADSKEFRKLVRCMHFKLGTSSIFVKICSAFTVILISAKWNCVSTLNAFRIRYPFNKSSSSISCMNFAHSSIP